MTLRRSVDRFFRMVVPFTGLFTVTSGPFDCGGGGGECTVTQEQAHAKGDVEDGSVSLDDTGDQPFTVPLRGIDDGVRGGWRCFGQVSGRAVRGNEDGTRLPVPLTASVSCQLSDDDASVTKRVWTFSFPLPESRVAAPPVGETAIEIDTNLSLPSSGARGCNAVLGGTITTLVEASAGSAARAPEYVTDDFVRDLSITVRFTSTGCGLRAGTLDIDLRLDESSYTQVSSPLCL